jgi:hypothetical protein
MVNKHKVEQFIIPRVGTALPSAGDDLFDSVTDQVNLPVGGFGVYTENASAGSYIPEAVNSATLTVANTPFLQFILHRDQSQDTTPLYEKKFIKSDEIFPTCPLRAVGQAAAVKQNSAWLVGAPDGTTGQVIVNDEAEYIVNGSVHGWRTDLFNGYNTPLKQGRFTTPDYFSSTLYTTTVQQRDHLLQHVAFDFNNEPGVAQTKEMVAICIDSQATVTPVVPPAANPNYVITLSAAAALSPGDVIIIGFTDDGQAVKLIVDQDLIQTFAQLIATTPLAGTEQIIPYARPTTANINTTGRIVAGGRAAGTPDAEVDHILFLALDHKQATYDEISQTKERIAIGLESGFDVSTASASVLNPSEGAGYAEDLKQWYHDTASHRDYIGAVKAWQPNSTRFPDEILDGGIYDVFILEHCFNRIASSGLNSTSPRKVVIGILETENFDNFAGFTGAANPHKAYVQDVLNNWVGSSQYPHTTINI